MNSKTVIDVRTPAEFETGHVSGSINIPLNQLVERTEEIRNLPQPLVLCCASGNRSGQAVSYLKDIDIACENGGSWLDVNFNYQVK